MEKFSIACVTSGEEEYLSPRYTVFTHDGVSIELEWKRIYSSFDALIPISVPILLAQFELVEGWMVVNQSVLYRLASPGGKPEAKIWYDRCVVDGDVMGGFLSQLKSIPPPASVLEEMGCCGPFYGHGSWAPELEEEAWVENSTLVSSCEEG